MAFPCTWIQGAQSALVDAGISALLPLFREHFGEGKLSPDYLLLTHSHYDHVGGLGALRRLVPNLKVVASAAAKEVLSSPKVHKFILDMNRKEEKLYGLDKLIGSGSTVPLSPEDLRVDLVLEDGDRLDLGGGVSAEATLTPGHTRDSVCYLVSPDQVLIGGETLGDYVSPEEIQPRFTSGYREYLDSLAKLARLRFEAVVLPHHGVRTGEDARSHLAVAVRCAEVLRQDILERIDRGLSPEQTAAELAPLMRHGLAALQPERAFMINLEAMIRVVLRERTA
jgi:glyoxylase-like metal-dependent hydrolase (beta-lactamase superfamily II)